MGERHIRDILRNAVARGIDISELSDEEIGRRIRIMVNNDQIICGDWCKLGNTKLECFMVKDHDGKHAARIDREYFYAGQYDFKDENADRRPLKKTVFAIVRWTSERVEREKGMVFHYR